MAIGAAASAGGQQPSCEPASAQMDASVGGALRSLASRAGLVFAGQVVAIERKGGVVEVRFSVQQTLRGPAALTYTLREWSGLWTGGQQRYRLGQRAMVFLQAPNAAGLSSPVDGMEGIVPIVPMGADAAPLLDVRRLAARVRRGVGQPMSVEAIAMPDAVAAALAGKDVAQPSEPVQRSLPAGWLPAPIQRPSQATVLASAAENTHEAQ